MPRGFHISRNAVIGVSSTIFQNVTITNATIGDNCYIGANAVIAEPIMIEDTVKIGAGTVVVDDIPDNCTVVGVKPRVIKK